LRSLPKRYREALPLDQLDSNGRRRSDKAEIPDELFLKRHGFPRRDPAFRNVEMLQYFVSFIPKKALRFFAGEINLSHANHRSFKCHGISSQVK
jgi:hypothetical protein